MNRPAHFARPVLALMVALSLATGVAQAQTKINAGWNLFTPEQDAEIGAQSVAQAEQQLPILRNASVQNYVNGIGQRLAANAGGPPFNYQFKVVNASDINAFALPGGPVYINRGIIENARNEGEVAGVMAHEIAHVALRHGTHQASKAYAAQAGLSILGGLLGGKVGQNTANVLNTVGGIGMNVLFLKFSRELETQADIRGAQILAASGYTPLDMVSFFQTLSSADKSKKATFLSDHPAPPDRISRIQKEASLLKVTSNPTSNVAELSRIKADLRASGNAPTMADIARNAPPTSTGRQRSTNRSTTGSVVQVDPPSSSMSSYTSRSGVYRIAFPSNWKVYEDSSIGVTIAPEGGIGEVGGKTEVVYGAIISHYNPFGNVSSSRSLRGSGGGYSGDVTLQQATNDLIAQIRQGGPHLRLISGSGQQFNLDGRTALAASLRGTNPNTRLDERVTLVTRQLEDGHLIYLLFVTPERDSSRYTSVLQSMVNSMQVDDDHAH